MLRSISPLEETFYNIRNVQLMMSTGCNLSCRYCYQDDKKRKNMSKEVMESFIDFLCDTNPETETLIDLFGGEPLLNWDIIKYGLELMEDLNLMRKLHFMISTNGTLIDDEIAYTLSKYNIHVNISVDGTPEKHNYERNNSYDKTIQGLRKLYEHGLSRNITARLTFPNNYFGNIEEHVKSVLNLGIPEVTFAAILAGGITDEELSTYEESMYRTSILILKYVEYGLAIIPKYMRNLLSTEHINSTDFKPRPPCHFKADTGFVVDTDGVLFGCSIAPNTDFEDYSSKVYNECVVGNIRYGVAYNRNIGGHYPCTVLTAKNDCINCEARNMCTPCAMENMLSSTRDYHLVAEDKCKLFRAKYRVALRLHKWILRNKFGSPVMCKLQENHLLGEDKYDLSLLV